MGATTIRPDIHHPRREFGAGFGHEAGEVVPSTSSVLSYLSESKEYDWDEDGAELSSLTPLRTDMLRGDYRCQYLSRGDLYCTESSFISGSVPLEPILKLGRI
jgi:hypothetical protein